MVLVVVVVVVVLLLLALEEEEPFQEVQVLIDAGQELELEVALQEGAWLLHRNVLMVEHNQDLALF